MSKELLIGVTEAGVMHTDADPPFDLETKFRMVKESGVYDNFDKTPPADQADEYRRRGEMYDLLILAGGWYYYLGQDEQLLEDNPRLADIPQIDSGFAEIIPPCHRRGNGTISAATR